MLKRSSKSMEIKKFLLVLIFLSGAVVLLVSGKPIMAQADESQAIPVDQIIVKYRDFANLNSVNQAQVDNQMQRINEAAGIGVNYFRPMSGEAHVMRLAEPVSNQEALAITKRLSELPEVEYAEPDYLAFHLGEPSEMPLLAPDDSRYGEQWHYFSPAAGQYGVNAPTAWDITTGSSDVYVAVLDTGITDHADLSGRWIGGYDMIWDPFVGNDGDGRDPDPRDPGDWVSTSECGYFHFARNSSWHGTHVAGTIGAATNNSMGVAGLNWVSKIVPVRVLGKCGGYTSDIADGIRWAAGLPVTGVPANPYPAKVLNLSLGGENSCGTTYQNAIDAAYGAGSVIVVSAGNDAEDASAYRPGNCNNVITVAATDRDGNLALFGSGNGSNFGSVVEISAPGGETYETFSDGVLSTLNTGATIPSGDTYAYYQGTSMAAPHIAGVASLMYSVNPSLVPADVLSIMQSTVTAFPFGSSCNTSICGSGIVNAAAAVAAVSPPAPELDPINNSDGDWNYTVSWTRGTTAYSQVDSEPSELSKQALSNDDNFFVYLPLVQKNFDGTYFILQEDDNADFTSPETVYTGFLTYWNATEKPPGTYYYRVMSSGPKGNSGWSNIESVTVSWITKLDFGGTFPGGWNVFDNSTIDGGEFHWGKRDCQVYTGSNSGWAVGGGAQGSGLVCGSDYPNNADSWMIYGPFSLSSAQAAELVFQRWLFTEWDSGLDKHDDFLWLASIDGNQFYGHLNYGDSNGWEQKVFDLTAVPVLGNLAGQNQVWIAFKFSSDTTITQAGGVYIDDVVLQFCTTNCTSTVSNVSLDNQGNQMEIPVIEVFQQE
jgi:subtilisin family serine protease